MNTHSQLAITVYQNVEAMNNNMKAIYDEGFQAALDGKSIDTNPYDSVMDRDLFQRWINGFFEAYDGLKEEQK